MEIIALPLLWDNYAWLLVDTACGTCAVVDPSEGPSVEAAIQERGLDLKWIVATHHHADHTGGIAYLMQPGMEVIGSAYDHDRHRIAHLNHPVEDGEGIELAGERWICLSVPGHTLGAVAYFSPSAQAVLTGDTLFTAGCGRLFEGTVQQMHPSLSRLAALPGSTQVYCGHEYTEKNLRFAQSLEPDHARVQQRLAQVQAQRALGKPTVPASLELEKATNPFLRTDAPALQQITGQSDPEAVFAALRTRRDRF